MLMIAEIILTAAAFRKGWRSRALLPMGFVLGLGLLLGAIAGGMGVSHSTLQTITICMIPVELIMVGVLVHMARRCPAPEVTPKETPVTPAIEATVSQPESVPA